VAFGLFDAAPQAEQCAWLTSLSFVWPMPVMLIGLKTERSAVVGACISCITRLALVKPTPEQFPHRAWLASTTSIPSLQISYCMLKLRLSHRIPMDAQLRNVHKNRHPCIALLKRSEKGA